MYRSRFVDSSEFFVVFNITNMPKPTLKSPKIRPYRLSTNYYRVVKRKRQENHKNIHAQRIPDERLSINTSITTISNNVTDIEEITFEDIDCLSDNGFEEENEFDRAENESLLEEQLSFLDKLKLWALTNKITISALNGLLQVLREHGRDELPRDGRTLLKTPPTIEISEMGHL